MSELINNREKRVQTLKEVILHLHRGEAPDAVRGRLAALVSEVDASEVAAMEQQLMSEGMSHQEVQALCDLHADVLKDVMSRPPTPLPLPPGHPVHQFRAENRALDATAQTAREQLRKLAALPPDDGRFDAERLEALRTFEVLWEVDKHYQRKEHLVFSVLERHGTTGPSKVMWGKDDEVRELLKSSLAALREEDVSGAELKVVAESVLEPALAALEGMIYKEENILFPMILGLFTAEDWGEIFRQSPEYGWCLVTPGTAYRPPEPHGKFVHIRYFAVRDAAGAYLGTLEVTQDLTRLRALEGERRLLAYGSPQP